MTTPTLPHLGREPQSRSAQRRMLQQYRRDALCWIVGLQTDARRYGGFGVLWVPALYPDPLTVLTVAVTQDDPREEYWLCSLLDAMRSVDPVATVAPFLVARDSLRPYAEAFAILDYPREWCDVATDYVCLRCAVVFADGPAPLCRRCETIRLLQEWMDEDGPGLPADFEVERMQI